MVLSKKEVGSSSFPKFRSMKSVTIKILTLMGFLSCLLWGGVTAVCVFSSTSTAVAHEADGITHDTGRSTTASNVKSAPEDMKLETLKNFVLHAVDHHSMTDVRGSSVFRERMRVEGGDWRSGSTYLIYMNGEGTAIIHGKNIEVEDTNLSGLRDANGKEIVKDLIAEANRVPGEPGCLEYVPAEGSASRWSCAVRFTREFFLPGVHRFMIAGLDHDEPGEEITESSYVPGITAGEVEDIETLQVFVKEAIKFFQSLVEDDIGSIARFRRISRDEDGPWRSGSMYYFVMLDNGLVFFNGLDAALSDTTLNIADRDDCNVGEEIIRVINSQDRQCRDLGLLPENPQGFVQYLWRDPLRPEYDDPEFLTDKTRSPGFAPKLTYVEAYSSEKIFQGSQIIFGAGIYIYPEDDSGGCAIAEAGIRKTHKDALLNLLLIVSVLVLGIHISSDHWARRGVRREQSFLR